jgi:hypothetical protein
MAKDSESDGRAMMAGGPGGVYGQCESVVSVGASVVCERALLSPGARSTGSYSRRDLLRRRNTEPTTSLVELGLPFIEVVFHPPQEHIEAVLAFGQSFRVGLERKRQPLRLGFPCGDAIIARVEIVLQTVEKGSSDSGRTLLARLADDGREGEQLGFLDLLQLRLAIWVADTRARRELLDSDTSWLRSVAANHPPTHLQDLHTFSLRMASMSPSRIVVDHSTSA